MQATNKVARLYGEGHRALEDFLGVGFAPASINVVDGMGSLACYAHGSGLIHMDSGLTGLVEGHSSEPSFSFRRELNRGLGVDMGRFDFVQAVGIHEDLHKFFSEHYLKPLVQLFNGGRMGTSRGRVRVFYDVKPGERYSHMIEDVSHGEIVPKPTITGINEAFAFWGMERVTGQRHLFEEFANHYSRRHGKGAGNALKFFYLLFHDISRTKGDGYVIENLVSLVRHYLPRMRKVELAAIDELLSTRRNTAAGAGDSRLAAQKPKPFEDVYARAKIYLN